MAITLDQWINQYRGFVDQMLSTIIPSPANRAKLLTQDAMNIWAQAMATKLFDPKFNYESLETVGDAALELAVVDYLIQKNADLTPSEITELKRALVEKSALGNISRKYGFPQWVLFAPPIVIDDVYYYDPQVDYDINEYINIHEDIFESFIGAMYLVGKTLGFDLVKRFVNSIYDLEKVDVKEAKASNKTRVLQLFEGIVGPKPITDYVQVTELPDRTWKFVLSLPDEFRNILKPFGIQLPKTIATVTERTKKGAEMRLYKMTIDLLQSKGFTKEFVDEYKIKYKKTAFPEIQPFLTILNDKISQEGFSNFDFQQLYRTASSVILQMRGITPTGETVTLGIIKVPVDGLERGRLELVQRYIRS